MNSKQDEYKPGQRWISNAEPGLGIGRIVNVEHRMVAISFDLIDEVRSYARDQAPLSRVRFAPGDTIRTADGIEVTVEQVTDRDGMLVYKGNYQGTETAVLETELDPNVTFSKPEERLFTHQMDDNRWYNLRYATLQHQARLAALPVQGLLGPRVSLIPHQFYIANEVASRHAPRVLLADEVGLGKTIEAGLIMSKQLVSGRASRMLVIVPPALTFQWFVEMIRRFNLQFTLLDEERCQQIEADNQPHFDEDEPGIDNPFDAQQLMLCSLDLFLDNPLRLEQAAEAEWDMIVVDEAHHLHWKEGLPGEDYQAVEVLSRTAKGLLLLTATPEQLGRLGHFSRLRLLDPSRYHDYNAFLAEESGYEEVALLIQQASDRHAVIDSATRGMIRRKLGDHAPGDDAELVHALLDRHGTGRVLFRNVRESVSGFPRRILERHRLVPERFPLTNAAFWEEADPRTEWLTDLLTDTGEKFLVICSRAEVAIALERYIRDRTTVRSVAFHEGLDLVARDRAANYFADTERGAQVLVCSEIGSEGRNFQFAHHLVMFDLPRSPDLIEQRIGRLDRIGQTSDVIIHVPFAPGSEQELLLRIYDEGLALFDRPNAAAQLVFDTLPDLDLSETDHIVDLAERESHLRLEELSSGRDRLIELNSHDPDVSAGLLADVSAYDNSNDLETYLEASFDLFGLESELLSEDIHRVKPTEAMVRHSPVSAETQDRYRYPELPDEGLVYTYNRETALSREDVQYLTWENPLVEQALDLVASDITGNCTVIVVKIPGIQSGTMLLESLHVIECVVPAEIGASRYLPPDVVRSMMTSHGVDVADKVPYSPWEKVIEIDRESIAKIIARQESGIRELIQHAEKSARQKFEPIQASALANMTTDMTREIKRLEALAEVNPNIRPDEIEYLKSAMKILSDAIERSQVRLDAVRLLICA